MPTAGRQVLTGLLSYSSSVSVSSRRSDERSTDGESKRVLSKRLALVFDLSLLALVPVVLLAVFSLPLDVREEFVFDVTDPSVVGAYTSHYVHLSQSHLVGNLAMYLLVVPLTYALSVLSDRQWLFRNACVTFLVAFPFALSGLQLVFPRERILFGFSGINAAFFGLLCFVLVSYASAHLSSHIHERDAPALLFVTVALISLITVPSRAWPLEIAAAALAVAVLYIVGVALKIRVPNWHLFVERSGAGRIELFVIGFAILLSYPFLGFQRTFTGDGAVFDLYSHLLGYCLAFIVVYTAVVIVE